MAPVQLYPRAKPRTYAASLNMTTQGSAEALARTVTVRPSREPKVPTLDLLPIGVYGLYLPRLGSETTKTRVFSEVKHGIGET